VCGAGFHRAADICLAAGAAAVVTWTGSSSCTGRLVRRFTEIQYDPAGESLYVPGWFPRHEGICRSRTGHSFHDSFHEDYGQKPQNLHRPGSR
jgi:hypothetical protein